MKNAAQGEREPKPNTAQSDEVSQALEPEWLQALGGIVISAAALESTLRLTLGMLQQLPAAELPGPGKTAGALIKANKNQLANCQRPIDDDTKHRILAALDRCLSVNEERNRAVHDAWAFADDGSVIQINSKVGGSRLATPADLAAIDHNIQACVIELFDAALGITGLTRDNFAARLNQSRQTESNQR